MQIFLVEKTFYPCAGLPLTPRMQRLIAAQACLLVLYRTLDDYVALRSILVYPDVFAVEAQGRDEQGVVHRQREYHSGESWQQGRIILAWSEVCQGARGMGDGSNVCFHEFAHQLDQGNGAVDGAPPLQNAEQAEASWFVQFSAAFQRLNRHHPEHGLINPYGATHPAEFFAVVTEVFFERPQPLAQQEPAVFALLVAFYGVDPRCWHGGEAG